MAWTRPTGRGEEIRVVPPGACPAGHRLRYPHVAISSDATRITYKCLADGCGVVIHRLHDQPIRWATQGMHGPTLDLPGYSSGVPYEPPTAGYYPK